MKTVTLNFKELNLDSTTNIFTSLTNTFIVDRDSKFMVDMINDSIERELVEILGLFVDKTYSKIVSAEIKGIVIDLKDEVTIHKGGRINRWLQLSKEGIGEYDHINIYETLKIGIKPKTISEEKYPIYSADYVFFIGSENFPCKVLEDSKEVEKIICDRIEKFILKRN